LQALVRGLDKLTADSLGGALLVIQSNGRYALNYAAGVWIDVREFDALVAHADREWDRFEFNSACASYRRALELYAGELCVSSDTASVIECERLRARYLGILARLADQALAEARYADGLGYALTLLRTDACREDAHRLAIRSYLHLGHRAQALRQFRICEAILQREFSAVPERATRDLFDNVRLAPETV
jgi:DNA-binding SARP family transcriptional activator